MRLDLHTHTYRSGDSTTTIPEYLGGLAAGEIDLAAVTDHLSIEGALELAEMVPGRIIVGQEFRVREGELIGLFLTQRIPPALTAIEAAAVIHAQGGLVYVPHPGDLGRSSIGDRDLEVLAATGAIDIIEVANSKIAPSGWIPIALEACVRFGIAQGAGSDAHVESAIGSTWIECRDRDIACATDLLEALAEGEIHTRHLDPPRAWRARIVPSN